MPKFVDLTGRQFERLTVLGLDSIRNHKSYWLCECECEAKTRRVILGTGLSNGNTRSCGCLQKEYATKHGQSASRLYQIYYDMLDRCYNSKNEFYKDYGGRGIIVCCEWDDFLTFDTWAKENGYKSNLTIERKDVDGDYTPENCCWATSKEQASNRSTNHLITIEGITKTLTQWAEYSGISLLTISGRIRLGWKDEDLLKPIDTKCRHKGA